MTLPVPEFIRRFLLHVLPSGFHRIRHYGLFASGARAQNIAQARRLLAKAARPRQDAAAHDPGDDAPSTSSRPCPCCGGRMIIIKTFERGGYQRPAAPSKIRIDTS